MNDILQARALSREYQTSPGLFAEPTSVRALTDVSFSLKAGQTLAVVGESGSGKSTLARLLTMIERPTSGELMIDGHDVTSAPESELRRLRKDVQYVFQNPYGSLNPRQKIFSALEESLLVNTPMSREARRTAARDMLDRVGLRPEYGDRYPHMFSGGQRQRIAIARSLMLKPKILVLDEPVAALDVSIRAQILNLLAELQDELGLTYVFISHDLSVVRHIADKVMVVYLGGAVEIADAEVLFGQPMHPYTRALLSATPVADPKFKKERIVLKGEMPSPFNPPSGCAFHPRCSIAMPECSLDKPPMKVIGPREISCFAANKACGQDSRSSEGAHQ